MHISDTKYQNEPCSAERNGVSLYPVRQGGWGGGGIFTVSNRIRIGYLMVTTAMHFLTCVAFC